VRIRIVTFGLNIPVETYTAPPPGTVPALEEPR
jgi:hypothetical protein